MICRSGKGGHCRTESVVYEVKCGQCESEGRGRRVYIGETGKSGYERMVQHWRSWRAKESDSFLWKHDANVHGGNMDESQLIAKIISKPKKALQRQIEEAVRILEEEPQALLNSKSGYGVNKIPRISVIMGEDIKDKRDDRKQPQPDEPEYQHTCVWEARGSDEEEVENQENHEGGSGGEGE